ncbi:hypothetical protein WSK_2596 [Novosphingobium sp. Rr 2-17]|nr:hypothetical protein WSK_2596 [Novosphingobium sp. Rr 2-17]
MKRTVAILGLAFAVAACGKGEPPPQVDDTGVPDAIAGMQAGPAQALQGQQLGTPNKDRVVTLGVLNKRNNITQDLVMKPGESRRLGNLVVKVDTCDKSLPWERPQDEGAFVQVFIEERRNAEEKLAWRKVFSGWLFKNSPGLNPVQHPVYDVWIKSCAMSFPGEEESPASAAASSSAKKASGSASTSAATASPSPAASPSSTPSASDSATPDAE